MKVWVVCGGPSGEAEVSRTSARGVAAALERAGHSATLVEFAPAMVTQLLSDPPDVVFPITHGALGEDGCLQGMLEVFNLPYVGCGVLASAIGANKPYAKALWRAAGLPVAIEMVIRCEEDLGAGAREIRSRLRGSVAIKPASGGSAIGVKKVGADEPLASLVHGLTEVLALDPAALIEPWIEGQELTCGVLDINGSARALPPTLILPNRADFYDFASKYAPGGSNHVCPAPLPASVIERVQELAVRAHQVIGGRDMSRVDFIFDAAREADQSLTILEINTLPGMTATSLYPEAAAKAGISFEELADTLVRQALARPRRAQPEVLAMPS